MQSLRPRAFNAMLHFHSKLCFPPKTTPDRGPGRLAGSGLSGVNRAEEILMTIPRVCGEGTFSPETLAPFTFSRYSSLPQHCHIHTIIYHHICRWWCEQPCCTFAGYHIPQFHLVAAFNCLALPLSASSVRYQTQYTAADPSRPVNISSQVF